jgi:predicted transglutaminase-like cysteine proteinase
MRKAVGVFLLTAGLLGTAQDASAAWVGMPRPLGRAVHRIQLGTPMLAPMAHARFCIQNPKECEVRRIAFRGGAIALTPERRAELEAVNRSINQAITPRGNMRGVAGEVWEVAPKAGDCNDYAVTKRHELLARGWPSHALLLAEVAIQSGEHHLVLVVRTREGDVVLDNLRPQVVAWSVPRYSWVRMQSPVNPKYWAKVASRNA